MMFTWLRVWKPISWPSSCSACSPSIWLGTALWILVTQKVALATSTGKLFLALQNVAEDNADSTRRVTLSDLSARIKERRERTKTQGDEDTTSVADTFDVNRREASSTPDAAQTETGSRLVVTDEYAIVGVTRGLERREYNVRHADKPY